jgi:predicted nucleic acid-binding protein
MSHGCLLKLYYPEPESARVAALIKDCAIVFVPLHELEVTNALAQKRFRKEASSAQVTAVKRLLESDVRAGHVYRPSMSWEDAFAEAKTFADIYTKKIGCRSLDIVHCAIARQLGVKTFVTSDIRQRKLAGANGLSCPEV